MIVIFAQNLHEEAKKQHTFFKSMFVQFTYFACRDAYVSELSCYSSMSYIHVLLIHFVQYFYFISMFNICILFISENERHRYWWRICQVSDGKNKEYINGLMLFPLVTAIIVCPNL